MKDVYNNSIMEMMMNWINGFSFMNGEQILEKPQTTALCKAVLIRPTNIFSDLVEDIEMYKTSDHQIGHKKQ